MTADIGFVSLRSVEPGRRKGYEIAKASDSKEVLHRAQTGLDFPPRGVVFHDLFDAEFEVGGHQSEPLGLTIDDSYDTHRTTQSLEHHHLIGSYDFAHGTVHMQGIDVGLRAHCRGQLGRITETFAILPRSSRTTGDQRGERVEDGINPQAREQVGAFAQAFAQRLEQPVVAEPAA